MITSCSDTDSSAHMMARALLYYQSFYRYKAHIHVAAQPGIAADRFAREIAGFLKALPARSRQLNAKPLGRTHSMLAA
jgi:hypothetical protein